MFGVDSMFRDMEDPLEGHPRYEKIRWACHNKDNVQIALDRKRNTNVAIKLFRRGPANSEYVRREILYHAELDHPNVIRLYQVFLTSNYLCVSLELGSQCLWQYVHSRGGRLREAEAQSIFVQLAEGVDYCHSKGLANRDIKLENCLVSSAFSQGKEYVVLKICDFGYCKSVEKDSIPKSFVGTSAYVSMDVVAGSAGQGYNAMMADLWSCGVVLYYMLEGRFPFGTEETNGGRHGLLQRIMTLDYDPFCQAPYAVQDLLSKIFCPPELRIDLRQLREHWWVQRGSRTEHMEGLRRLLRQGSKSQIEQQSVQEMEQLIHEACLPLPVDDMDDEWDEYLK